MALLALIAAPPPIARRRAILVRIWPQIQPPSRAAKPTSTGTTRTRRIHITTRCSLEGGRVLPARQVDLGRAPDRHDRRSRAFRIRNIPAPSRFATPASCTSRSRCTTARPNKLEDYAKRYAGEKDAADLLSDAIRLRAALGDRAKQIADTNQWIRDVRPRSARPTRRGPRSRPRRGARR